MEFAAHARPDGDGLPLLPSPSQTLKLKLVQPHVHPLPMCIHVPKEMGHGPILASRSSLCQPGGLLDRKRECASHSSELYTFKHPVF